MGSVGKPSPPPAPHHEGRQQAQPQCSIADATLRRTPADAGFIAVVDHPVAVVVLAVLHFWRAGIHVRVAVVAILSLFDGSVRKHTGDEGLGFRALAVPILVAEKGVAGTGVQRRVRVVHQAITVFVATAADFGDAGMDGGVLIVTVA